MIDKSKIVIDEYDFAQNLYVVTSNTYLGEGFSDTSSTLIIADNEDEAMDKYYKMFPCNHNNNLVKISMVLS